jgi:exo-1,4-beta-D-glucosaminidase
MQVGVCAWAQSGPAQVGQPKNGLSQAGADIPLRDGWTLQSAAKAPEDGSVLSLPEYSTWGWSVADVPGTVLAVQVADGAYKDPYFGTNLRKIPGTTYPIGHTFANLPMPADSPYLAGWWYRKEFVVPRADAGRRVWLHFGGINYRADVWLNGKKIADRTQVAGAYRSYDFDVTAEAKPGVKNVLAVETFAPTTLDLGINWVDWSPTPPDKDMGLWGPVRMSATGPVALRSPLVVTKFPDDSLAEADLTVYAELRNATDRAVRGTVGGKAAGVPVSQAVELAAHEERTVVFDPEHYPQLKLRHPQLWWPRQMGEPHLETLHLRFTESGGAISDEKSIEFGIRAITSELNAGGYRQFKVNSKPILIRGGGWSPDMMMREDPAKLRDEFRMVRDLGLNTIRLEGKLETDYFFHLADQQGILVMAGWCCCDQWEHWKDWTPENYTVAGESLRSEMLRLRAHPSLLMWLNGSDNPPPADVESLYLRIEEETHWPNPILSSASAKPTTVTGQSGVKMTGPYDYVAPSYWYVDTRNGGAYGFNTETSPGPAIPSEASLRQFIPADELWPRSAAWSYHMAGGGFASPRVFDDAMTADFAAPQSLEQYIQFAQTMSYDSERAMFEAYSRNKYVRSTGVIQWMLNNAWPSMFWHLFDYSLDAGGNYFGAKKACEPLHIQYSYDDHSIVVVNSTYQAAASLTAVAHVYDLQMKEVFSQQTRLDAEADNSFRALTIPDSVFAGSSPVWWIDLTLKNAAGATVSRNFYWVPARLTQFDWTKTNYTHTPALQHEELSSLLALPKAQVAARAERRPGSAIEVRLQNPSATLAFQVVAAVRTASGGLIAPVLWSDNYIELMPGESRVLTAELPHDAPTDAVVLVSGWNVAEQTLHPGR